MKFERPPVVDVSELIFNNKELIEVVSDELPLQTSFNQP